MRPQHTLSRLAKETPRPLVLVRSRHRVDMNVVLDLARQQVAVLEPDLLRRPLQMHIGPSALVEFVATLQARVRGLRGAMVGDGLGFWGRREGRADSQSG